MSDSSLSIPKQITLSEWILSGGGGQGESYVHKTDPKLMLKLFNYGVPARLVTDELELARRIYALGIPTPRPGELVSADGRTGIVFERILNKKSFFRAYSDDASLLSDLAGRFAVIGRKIHTTRADKEYFTSMHKLFRFYMENDNVLSAKHRELCERAFSMIPDGDTCVHGDFHMGNVITDGRNDYLIDLGTFGYGHPDWDLSMCWFTANMTTEEIADRFFHLPTDKLKLLWNAFADEYYGGNRPSDNMFPQMFAPYVFLRSLFFDVSSGGRDPFPLKMRERLEHFF